MSYHEITKNMFDALYFTNKLLEDSPEFKFGIQQIKKKFTSVRTWKATDLPASSLVDLKYFPDGAEQFLIVINPALIVSDNLQIELDLISSHLPEHICCLLPSDQRSEDKASCIDYATRTGFDRFVINSTQNQRWVGYDGRKPWIYSVLKAELISLLDENEQISWDGVPFLLNGRTLIAQNAYVHSFADYYYHDRAELLNLIPLTVNSLLDVGGGAGLFAEGFIKNRGGKATLLELSEATSTVAQSRELDVIKGRFESTTFDQRYDCVAMLDVFEHIADPWHALSRVHDLLTPGGFLLMSVPNVGHWSVVSDLIEGRFDYQSVGILCNTHLRFYTKESLKSFLTDNGYIIQIWEDVKTRIPNEFMQYIKKSSPSWLVPDIGNLSTESFHLLAKSTKF